MKQKGPMHDHVFRYLIVSIVFCVVCVFYLGRLFYVQISGRQNQYDMGTQTRIVSVQAARGEIYDRNGKPLVTNRYSYDLVISRASFEALTPYRSNSACLQLLNAVEVCGEEGRRTVRYAFPLEGTYPNYTDSGALETEDPNAYARMRRVMAQRDLDAETASAWDLIDCYTETYELLGTDSNGNRLFSDAEIDRILRLRYDMDATVFNDAVQYSFVSELSSSSNLIVYVSELNLTGVNFTFDVERVYAYPEYATHILGRVGPIFADEWEYYNSMGYPMNAVVGKSGCEAAFESILRGVDGKMRIEIDADGNVVREEMLVEPVAGKNIRLTIDIDLQIAAEDGLAENVQNVGGSCDSGAAVVMHPDTFEVLAMASYPTVDMNYATLGVFEPGSTFKLGMAIAALMEGEIETDTNVYCSGKYEGKVTCDNHSPGLTSLQTAISQSCNSYFCECGGLLGIDTIELYMRAFGFGQSTGFELGDAAGRLPKSYREQIGGGKWEIGDTWNASIGQGETGATPIQLASYLSTLVNGGTRRNSTILHSVYEYGNDTPVFRNVTEVQSELNIPEDALDAVYSGMREVVTSHWNINNNMKNVPVEVGGKTGTAQTSAAYNNALFVAAAPYDDPEIVISVVLPEGRSGEYASLTAARILETFYAGVDAQ